MNEIIIWLLVIGFICWIFLILRFIQPELIYTLRQAIVKVEIAKSLLEMDLDLPNARNRFHKALSKDFRSESRRSEKAYIDERLQKVKELYRLQEVIPEDKNYQNCIVELANLLSNLAQNLTLNKDNKYPLTLAEEILEFLKSKRLEKDPDSMSLDSESIEKWFESYPISVEQSVEVIIAVIYALLIRESHNL